MTVESLREKYTFILNVGVNNSHHHMADLHPENWHRNLRISVIILFIYFFGYQVRGEPIKFLDLNLSHALAKAKKEQKLVFIDFYTTWCRPCKVMEMDVFSDDDVGNVLNEQYVPLRINADIEKELTLKHDIRVYPTLLVLDRNGKTLFRNEGAMDRDSFLKLARDIPNLKIFQHDYNKNESKLSAVKNYASALHWVNPLLARRVVKKYIQNTSPKKWDKEYNWELIRDYIPGTELALFKKILAEEDIYDLFPEEFKQFAENGVADILQKSLELNNTYQLKQYENCVLGYKNYFQNPDSMVLVANMIFASENDPKKLPDLLDRYINEYATDKYQSLAYYARLMTEKYFNREILEQAISWGKSSIRIKENSAAFLAIALAHEKLNEFKQAYAYMALAEGIASNEEKLEIEPHLERIYSKLSYELHDGVNTVRNRKATEDGRFTLGAGSQRLMYGYPVPTSTSHFIINIDGHLASNSPKLANKGLHYLTGHLTYEGDGMTPQVKISFDFQGTIITQTLTPVDKDFQEIEAGFAQYYMVKYEFQNQTRQFKKIGLGVLFDTMIDDNDYCVISADGHMVDKEWGFTANQMPRELLFYRTPGDTSDMMGTAILKGFKATRPDKMVIGRWPVLHEVTWELKPQKVKYGDSAYFLKWENRNIRPGGKLDFVTYYGLPAHKKPALKLIVEDNTYLTMRENIYFDHESSKLDLNAKMKIGDLVNNDKIEILGVLLNGYTDIIGGNNFNFTLSEKRIKNVGNIFTAYNIPYVPKPYGLEMADRNSYNIEYGNSWDRRVEIVIYYKVKNQAELVLSSIE